MKLLIFIHSLSSGGAERVTANLANYWAEKGWGLTIATLTGQEHDFYDLHPTIKRIPLNLDGDSSNLLSALHHNYRRIRALRTVLKQEQPDVALAMMTTANILLALAAKGGTIRLVGSERIHPPAFPLGGVWEWLRRQIYRYFDVVTALTEESAHWIKKATSAKVVQIIPNAVTWPIPASSPCINPDGVLGEQFNLIAVGRLTPQKGFDRLLNAFAELASRFPDWHLTILGEGECRQALEAQRDQLGLAQQVSLPGVVGNLAQWYQQADLFVMSSLFEGFPNTLVEAMAHGLPVISVDCDTGPRDIIRDKVDGLLVPQNNHQALVEGLATLMGDEPLCKQYATRAIEVRERFSMERIAGMWEMIFEEGKVT